MRPRPLAHATAAPSSRPRRRRCRPRRSAAPAAWGPARSGRRRRRRGSCRTTRPAAPAGRRGARGRAPRAAASSRSRSPPWRTAARARRAGRVRRSPRRSASGVGRCRTKTRSLPMHVSRSASAGRDLAAALVGDEPPGRVEQPDLDQLGDRVDQPGAAQARAARRRRSRRASTRLVAGGRA